MSRLAWPRVIPYAGHRPARRGRLALCLALAAGVSVVLACGGSSAPAQRLPTHPPPTPIEFRSCDPAGGVLQIVEHGDGLEKYVRPVHDALGLAQEYAASNFGWQPGRPVCTHIFESPDAFVEGLQQAGWGRRTAEDFRNFWGTVGTDRQTGLDAVYLDAGVIGVPELAARTAVHEYFHIVQGHVGGTMGGPGAVFPQWFIEGMAYWEVDKIMGVRYKNWLTLVQEDVRDGRDIPLSSLSTWRQWSQFYGQGDVQPGERPTFVGFKVNAAFMFLEQIAGPTAPADILRASTEQPPQPFEDAFQRVAGLTLDEFEARLREFILAGPH